ncbi:MAG: hypothetical protein AAF682_08910 [Planctomycetota bacterium]
MKPSLSRAAAVGAALACALSSCGTPLVFHQHPGANGPGTYAAPAGGTAATYPTDPWGRPTQGAPTQQTGAPEGLPPQEYAPYYPDSYLESMPVAGPSPRNPVSGGVTDGGVVPAEAEGATEVAASTHGVEPTESGRLYILELYQQVLDQRDSLEIEVGALQSELEAAKMRIAQLEGTTSTSSTAVTELEQENQLLRSENRDLAARLTTAQIRRLEAEKLLLETKIEVQRAMIEATSEPKGTGLALRDE